MTTQRTKLKILGSVGTGSAPWLDTGMDVTLGQRFVVMARGRVSPYSSTPDPNIYPGFAEWFGPDGDGVTQFPGGTLMDPGSPPMKLLGRIGASGTVFPVGRSYDAAATATGRLYLTINDLQTYFADNRGYFLTRIVVDPPGVPPYKVDCPCADDTIANPTSANPIALYDGDKLLTFKDLEVQTPAGALTFERSYSQSKQGHSAYQFMGLGWFHNHAIKLVFSSSTAAQIFFPKGGILSLSGSGGHLTTQAGSSSVLDASASNYILTAQDKSQYEFEPNGVTNEYRLKYRRFSSGEQWTYTYVSNQLTEIDDGYGRKLKFGYRPAGGYDAGQLWHVGDHTASNLDQGLTSGRVITFSYSKEKLAGADYGSPPKALLASITDVRGNNWVYLYYGEQASETDATKRSLLLQRVSPSVDLNGDNLSDVMLTLEKMSYTLSGSTITAINQKRGGAYPLTGTPQLETNLTFPTAGSNVTNESLVGTDISRNHIFANGAYLGSSIGSDADLNLPFDTQILDNNYRPMGQVDGVDNDTSLTWTTDGKQLTKVTDAAGKDTLFAYNTDDTLKLTTDADGRKTLYVYDTARRQPTLVVVADSAVELPITGDMEISSGWSSVASATTSLVTTPVDSGTNARQVTATANGAGIESIGVNLQANFTYIVSARFRRSSGQAKLQLVNGASVLASVLSDAAGTNMNIWQTLRLIYTTNSAISGAKLQCLAQGAAATFYVDSLHLVETVNVQRWQEFIYDSKMQTLFERVITPSTAVVQQETERVYGTTGNDAGLLQQLIQRDLLQVSNTYSYVYTYDTQGRVVTTRRTSLFGGCEFSHTVYDPSGLVLATVCGPTSTTPTTVADAQQMYVTNNQNTVTTYEYDTLGRRIKVNNNDGTGSSNKQTTFTFYDALDRVIRVIANYVNPVVGSTPTYAAPGDWYWNAAGSVWKDGTGVTIGNGTNPNDGTLNTQNVINDTVYNRAGNVRKQIDALGNVTLYGYDSAGRVVKTVRSASWPDYNNEYVTDAFGHSPDPDLSEYGTGSYPLSSAPDQDIITTVQYNANGQPVKTMDELSNVTFTVYDALKRPVKVVRNAKPTARIDLFTNDASYSAANDPASASYTPGSTADQDLITSTEYDAMGRVVRQTDVLGTVTYTVYDGQGRVSKSIANYVAQGTTDPKDWYWYDDGSTQRWQRSVSNTTAIDHGVNNDQNIITYTVYDPEGRVLYTQDSLGRRTWIKYDGFGRTVKTIANAAALPTVTLDSADDPRSDSYVPSTQSDLDRITLTTYDSQGRVQWTQDPNGRKNWTVYDDQGRVIKTILNCTYVSGTPAPEDPTYVGSSNSDNDIINKTEYDPVTGRVTKTIDPVSHETRFYYDIVGRRTQTIVNYGDGIFDGAFPDVDLIQTTQYDILGRMIQTTDARGTATTVTYDRAGRRLTAVQAANTPLSSTNYTVYDRAGRVLRTIVGYTRLYKDASGIVGYAPTATEVLPYIKTGNAWDFIPPHNGSYNDRNLITELTYDLAGRTLTITNPVGSVMQTTYYKDGSVEGMVDPEGTITKYRYDKLRRRFRVVQGYVVQGTSDPQNWVWDTDMWKQAIAGTPIGHGSDNDQNIIVDVSYDRAGRVLNQREPNGNVTSYTYDLLNRRTSLTNPLLNMWLTDYTDLGEGKTRQTLTYPDNFNPVLRDFDRLGRLSSIQYGGPFTTPDVAMTYDKLGNRLKMSEHDVADFGHLIRETNFGYDAVQRLTSVGYDTDGNGTSEETVAYTYDAGGLRTKLVLPGTLNVIYTYDARGQLASLKDWDNQTTTFAYDNVGRQIVTERPNRLRSRYEYDAAGRLKRLRHSRDIKSLALFEYQHDKRGNRVRALECVARTATINTTTLSSTNKGVVFKDTWADVSGYKESTAFGARLSLIFLGDVATLSMGQGPDHSIYDVYIDGSLWQSFDGYAVTAAQRNIVVTTGVDSLKLQDEGPHILEVRNRAEKNKLSSGFKVRFKELSVANRQWFEYNIGYMYDGLSRLKEARYADGVMEPITAVNTDLAFRFVYTYDRAGNRLDNRYSNYNSPLTGPSYTYNEANQMSFGSVSFSGNGNMVSDPANSISWDLANRQLKAVDKNFHYDGAGNIFQKDDGWGGNVWQYLTDFQPGLPVTLREIKNMAVTYYLHGPHGMHAYKDSSGWHWVLEDGLQSVCCIVDDSLTVQLGRLYRPYGESLANDGLYFDFGFTGEMGFNDGYSGGLYNLRARHYDSGLGVFTSLDPFAGIRNRTMSLNGYSWVEGNTPNMLDPRGTTPCKCDAYRSNSRDYIACVNGYSIFDYNRHSATRAAFSMATRGEASYDNMIQLSEHNSANFMSLAIFAGGFPMIKDPNGNVGFGIPGSGQDGWHASINANNKIEGNYVWKNHNVRDLYDGLIGYITGRGAGGERISTSGSIVSSLFPVQGTVNKNDNFKIDLTMIRNIISQLNGFKQGDYVYIDSSEVTHGFMLVGFGPALKCDAPALDNTWLSGDRVMADADDGSEFLVTEDGSAIYGGVPYVVDWGGQRNTARPFYCSTVPDKTNGFFFGHFNWRFISVPDKAYVLNERLYTPMFSISSLGNISRK